MHELFEFGLILLGVAAAGALALGAHAFSARIGVPAPGILLLAAAAASDLFPGLVNHVPTRLVERAGVVALLLILFAGGLGIGWRSAVANWVPITSLGLVGTLATGGLLAVLVHELLGYSWATSWLLGAALAPTDPAVMFSVLGGFNLRGRSDTILSGESGFNDPVSIAFMIGAIEVARKTSTVGAVAVDVIVELVVGMAIGVVGALLLRSLLRLEALADHDHYPIGALFGAVGIYAVTAVAHGSGFLAVFVAGLVLGDTHAPFHRDIKHVSTVLASFAEIVVFILLGLTVSLGALGHDRAWLDGILIALLLTFVVRPLVAAPLLAPLRLSTREKAFVAWAGLRGAVPILLATFALLAETDDAERLYGLVFVCVAFSVLVQGATVPRLARRLGLVGADDAGSSS